MNVLDAAYRTGHNYPGGIEALAARMGVGAVVLRNKLNPNNPSHRLALDEADMMIGLTGDCSIVQALAANHGGVFVPISGAAPQAGSVLAAVLVEHSSDGDLSRVVNDSLADGKITPNEMREIEACAIEAQAAVVRLTRTLQQVRAKGMDAAHA